jgi:hypothetical protein
VDEELFYERAEVADFASSLRRSVAAHASHGAHVMDLACGWDPAAAPDWKIVCVQLPVATTANSSGATLAPYAIDAVKYIQRKAQELSGGGNPLPVVINFSYGVTAGPHNGNHVIEQAIDHILTTHAQDSLAAPMHVVIPSGNSHLARIHARIASPAGSAPVELPWRIQPDDLTPSFLEIHLPGNFIGSDRVRVCVTSPDGSKSGWLGEDENTLLSLVEDGEVLWEVGYHVQSDTEQGRFLLALQPSARVDPDATLEDRIAPSGVWTVFIENQRLGAGQEIHAWIQRDAPFGYPRRGRQSYFDDPAYTRFADSGRELEIDSGPSVVRRSSSMNAIATGETTVVVGGFIAKEMKASKYSAGGPLLAAGASKPARKGPHVVAVSDDSVVHAGVLAAGTRSGSVVPINGTSVAAPRITRWIAEQLALGRKDIPKRLRKLAEQQEVDPTRPSPQPETRIGAGRVLLQPKKPLPRDRRVES